MSKKKETPSLPAKLHLQKGQKVSASFWEQLNVRLSNKERLLFTKYLSVLLKAGLPIDEAIRILCEQAKGSMKVILKNLQEYIQRGETLADGLHYYKYIFGIVYINLIRAGELSGSLQQNLDHLVEQMQKEYDLKQKVRGSMFYPAIIIVGSILISIGIIVFVLPNLIDIFSSLKIELPLTTRILLWVANLTTTHGFAVALGFLGFICFVFFIRRVSFLKPFFHTTLLYIPLLGNITQKVNLARITRLMGTMLEGGLTIDEVVPIVQQVIKNVCYQKIFAQVYIQLQQGEAMSMVFEGKPKLIPLMALRIIHVGELTGSLPDMLLYLADFYEKEVDEITRNLATLLEPMLLIFVGVLVGGLALSIMMPIYQVIGSF